MKGISKWEITGVPAAVVFESIYELGWLEPIGVSAENVPRLMVVCFVAVALLRSLGQFWLGRKSAGGSDQS